MSPISALYRGYLRARDGGQVVNVTSIAGRAPSMGYAMYPAAKSALEGMSAALALEVAPFGVKVSAVAPGAFRTDFLSEHLIRKSEHAGDAYHETIGRSAAAFDAANGQQLGDPALAAQAILKLADADNPPLHLLLGGNALARARTKIDQVVDEMMHARAPTSPAFRETKLSARIAPGTTVAPVRTWAFTRKQPVYSLCWLEAPTDPG